MKEKLMKMREEKDGFTLAELLIVVAIIAVLVAIAIPVFTSTLHNAQAATDEANARSLYADITADYLSNGNTVKNKNLSADITTATFAKDSSFKLSNGEEVKVVDGTITIGTNSDGSYYVAYVCSQNDADHTKNFGKA